jgi:flagellar motor switch protein FliM
MLRRSVGTTTQVPPEQAFARAVEAGFATVGLDVTVSRQGSQCGAISHFLNEITENALLLRLETDDGQVGALAMGRGAVVGLVEWQTMGQFLSGDVPQRSCTRIEESLALQVFSAICKDLPKRSRGTAWLQTSRPGRRFTSQRQVVSQLTEGPYHVLRLTIGLGGEGRDGEIVLALPQPVPLETQDSDAPRGREKLQANVRLAPADLSVVLAPLSLSLAKLRALQVGDLLELPTEALAKVTLRTGTGTIVKRVQLGRQDGLRAVRLGSPTTGTGMAPQMSEPEALTLSQAMQIETPVSVTNVEDTESILAELGIEATPGGANDDQHIEQADFGGSGPTEEDNRVQSLPSVPVSTTPVSVSEEDPYPA